MPVEDKTKKKNQAKYNDTYYVEMQRMTMTLEFQGFVGMEQRQDNSYAKAVDISMLGKQ